MRVLTQTKYTPRQQQEVSEGTKERPKETILEHQGNKIEASGGGICGYQYKQIDSKVKTRGMGGNKAEAKGKNMGASRQRDRSIEWGNMWVSMQVK